MTPAAGARDGRDGPRVLIVSLSTGVWGAERSLLQLAAPLERRGFRLRLVAPDGAWLETWRSSGRDGVRLDVPEQHGIRGQSGDRPGVAALAREALAAGSMTVRVARLLRSSADVVHSNSLWGHAQCASAARLARRPAVLELHDLVAPGAGRRLLAAAVRLSTVTVAISSAVAEVVTGPARSRVRIVPQAVDLERFTPAPADAAVRRSLGARDGRALIGIVGRVDHEKGVDIAVRATALLGDRAHLAVVGAPMHATDRYARDLAAEAAALGASVTFAGARADVPEVLRACDVVVNASRAEPFGLSVLEAQACGTPVVATRAGGIPEFVEDGTTGLLVAPGDATALAAALTRLLDDAALRNALVAHALARVRSEFGVERRADALAAVYREVTAA